MSHYEVGKGKPPKHAQFKKGRSGNPRGRPRRLPRAEIESQIGKDMREIMRTTRTVGGKTVTMQQALLMVAVNQALQGKVGHMKQVIELLRLSYRDNQARKPDLELLDGLNVDLVMRDPKLRELWTPIIARLAKLSKTD